MEQEEAECIVEEETNKNENFKSIAHKNLPTKRQKVLQESPKLQTDIVIEEEEAGAFNFLEIEQQGGLALEFQDKRNAATGYALWSQAMLQGENARTVFDKSKDLTQSYMKDGVPLFQSQLQE